MALTLSSVATPAFFPPSIRKKWPPSIRENDHSADARSLPIRYTLTRPAGSGPMRRNALASHTPSPAGRPYSIKGR
jgi:hypothetical protein